MGRSIARSRKRQIAGPQMRPPQSFRCRAAEVTNKIAAPVAANSGPNTSGRSWLFANFAVWTGLSQ